MLWRTHRWSLIILATLASLASNIGSIPAYWVGANGGRPMVERYGSYLLLSKRDLDLADRFFAKFGSITVLIGRMLPIVRTFIAFPAGIAQHEPVALPHLYLHRFVAVVLCAGVGMEAGRQMDATRNPRFKASLTASILAVEAVLAGRHHLVCLDPLEEPHRR